VVNVGQIYISYLLEAEEKIDFKIFNKARGDKKINDI
jgi:hypothetical protein